MRSWGAFWTVGKLIEWLALYLDFASWSCYTCDVVYPPFYSKYWFHMLPLWSWNHWVAEDLKSFWQPEKETEWFKNHPVLGDSRPNGNSQLTWFMFQPLKFWSFLRILQLIWIMLCHSACMEMVLKLNESWHASLLKTKNWVCLMWNTQCHVQCHSRKTKIWDAHHPVPMLRKFSYIRQSDSDAKLQKESGSIPSVMKPDVHQPAAHCQQPSGMITKDCDCECHLFEIWSSNKSTWGGDLEFQCFECFGSI